MPRHDLIVIGAGPGGYVAAIRAAQLGLSVACVDDNEQPGGTCLRVGCIPSKALLESSERFVQARDELPRHGVKAASIELDLQALLGRKDEIVKGLTDGVKFLFKKNKISHYVGRGELTGARKVNVHGGGDITELEAERIIIATGSKSASLPDVELDGKFVTGSTQALDYEAVPERLVVIGAGYIGLELGSVWSRLGAKVTVLEYLDRILPGMDDEIAGEALKTLKKQGVAFKLGSRVTGVRPQGDGGAVVELDGEEPIEADRVLVAVGRQPNTAGLGLDSVGVEIDERGFIPVDSSYQTKAEGVYAIGDVIGGPLLAHKAEEEAVACVEAFVTGYGHVNYGAIPGVVYTEPEIASVGKTEEQLKSEGAEYSKGIFPYQANARARTLGHTTGRVKILADSTTDRVLGVHIIGARAGDLIAEAVLAIEFGASSEDIALTSHAHPSLSEIVKEAALAVAGRPIHI